MTSSAVWKCLVLVATLLPLMAFGADSCPESASYLGPGGNPRMVTLARWGVTTCYWVAAPPLGSNDNDGRSKARPWASAPGMQGCTGACLSKQSSGPKSGEGYIFRGGDTWIWETPAWWKWQWGGSEAHYIYLGVDQSWFSGKEWIRPILNGDRLDFRNAGLLLMRCDYVIVDNFEFKGLFWKNQPTDTSYYNAGLSNYVIFENNYLHDVTHLPASPKGPCSSDACSGGDPQIISGGSSANPSENNFGQEIRYNVIDNSDGTNGGDCCAAIQYGNTIIHHNYIANWDNGLEPNAFDVHDNTIGPIRLAFDHKQDAVHENSFENVGHKGGNGYYYNNLIFSGTAVTWWTCPDVKDKEYVFNNVVYDTDEGNVYNVCGGSYFGQGGTQYSFSNTWECGRDHHPNQVCSQLNEGVGFGTLNAANNYWRTGNSIRVGCGRKGVCNVATEYRDTGGNGYTMSNRFSPTSSNSPTIANGTNLTNWCANIAAPVKGHGDLAAAIAACKLSTAAGVALDHVKHQAISPNITPVPRPTSGHWDIGAYQSPGLAH